LRRFVFDALRRSRRFFRRFGRHVAIANATLRELIGGPHGFAIAIKASDRTGMMDVFENLFSRGPLARIVFRVAQSVDGDC